jgi:tetratricopeptide (TPR) repeat protein
MNAASANQGNQAYAARLEAAVKRGEKPADLAEQQLAWLRQPVPVRSVELGDQTTGWEQFIHFLELTPEGKQVPLPWTLRLLSSPKEKTLTLDATVTAQLDYALEPEVAAGITPGDYQVVAVIEVPPQAYLQPDRWRGRVESQPDKLSVKARPARLEPAEQEKLELDLAGYFSVVGDPGRALDHAQKALAANPHSIRAQTIIGESKEAQGDLQGALTAFQTATGEFYRQHPHSYEAPLYLIGRTEDILEKLHPRP